MPRARQLLPSQPTRTLIDNALQGAYRRIRFTPSEKHETISSFFADVTPLIEETADLLSHEQYQVKICAHLETNMAHKTGDKETMEEISFILKATPLSDLVIESLAPVFEERLSQFLSRGSNFRLSDVKYLDLVVVQCNNISHKIGH